jgi:hypothetical protein
MEIEMEMKMEMEMEIEMEVVIAQWHLANRLARRPVARTT